MSDDGPDLRTIECLHGVECGACSLLGQPYEQQLVLKRRWLLDAVEERARIDHTKVLATLPSPRVSAYRNRAKMTISTDRERHSVLGYFRRRSREVIDAPQCQVLVPELLETTRQLRTLLNSPVRFPFALRHIDLRCGSDPSQQHLTLVVASEDMPRLPIDAIGHACGHLAGIGINLNPRGGGQVIKGRIEPLAGVREVFVECAGLSLRVSPGSFFQVNLGILPEIHRRMEEFLGTGELLVDLFAGVGTHALAMRRLFTRVLCVEGVRASVADARATIAANRIDSIEVIASPVKRALHRLQAEAPDAVILNPSREGADTATLEMLLASPARRIAYLSCEPKTLVRDLEVLINGGFTLATLQPVDMMPQTRQVEALALLHRH